MIERILIIFVVPIVLGGTGVYYSEYWDRWNGESVAFPLSVTVPPMISYFVLRGIPSVPPSNGSDWLLPGLFLVLILGYLESLTVTRLVRNLFRLGYVAIVLFTLSYPLVPQSYSTSTIVGLFTIPVLISLAEWEWLTHPDTYSSSTITGLAMISLGSGTIYGGLESSFFVGELVATSVVAFLPWTLYGWIRGIRNRDPVIGIFLGLSMLFWSFVYLYGDISGWPFLVFILMIGTVQVETWLSSPDSGYFTLDKIVPILLTVLISTFALTYSMYFTTGESESGGPSGSYRPYKK